MPNWQKKMGFKAHILEFRTGRLTLIATSVGNNKTAASYCKTKIIADLEKNR